MGQTAGTVEWESKDASLKCLARESEGGGGTGRVSETDVGFVPPGGPGSGAPGIVLVLPHHDVFWGCGLVNSGFLA